MDILLLLQKGAKLRTTSEGFLSGTEKLHCSSGSFFLHLSPLVLESLVCRHNFNKGFLKEGHEVNLGERGNAGGSAILKTILTTPTPHISKTDAPQNMPLNEGSYGVKIVALLEKQKKVPL